MMEDLVLELKNEIIESLNLEDVKPEDIDADRAQKAFNRAKKRIDDYKAGDEDINIIRAEAALKRAAARLTALGKHGE